LLSTVRKAVDVIHCFISATVLERPFLNFATFPGFGPGPGVHESSISRRGFPTTDAASHNLVSICHGSCDEKDRNVPEPFFFGPSGITEVLIPPPAVHGFHEGAGRLLKNPCIVSGSISKQIKEREGGDAVSASSTPSDAEVRREIGPFDNFINHIKTQRLTDYIYIPVRSNAVHLPRPRRRKCSTMLPLHRLCFSPCGRNKCIRTDATRVFQQSPGHEDLPYLDQHGETT